MPSGDDLGLFVCVLSKEGWNQRLVERTGTRYFELVILHKQAFVFSWLQQLRASPRVQVRVSRLFWMQTAWAQLLGPTDQGGKLVVCSEYC